MSTARAPRLSRGRLRLDPVVEHLDQAFDLTVEGPPRKRALRCSSLPYCCVLDAVLPSEPEQGNLSGALYMGIGTVMHASLQNFLSLAEGGASMWGSWRCASCERVHENQFRPQPCCDVPLLYVEASLRVSALTGHVDFIARYPGGRWVLVDFKTTGADPGRARRQHLLQVRHYVAMLKIQHGIEIDDVYIVYVGRGHLDRWVHGPYDARRPVGQTMEWIDRAVAGFKAATRVRRGDDSYIQRVVAHRPCKSVEDHDDYMSRKFEFSSTPCAMLPHCSAGSRACERAVRALLDGRPE